MGQIAAVDQIPVANKDFHLKEYESLKQEVSEQIEHTRKLEIYAVGGIAAFYAWFIGAQTLPRELLIIPLLLAGLGAWRSGASLKRINEIAAYLVHLEGVFALSSERLGWETHRKNNRSSPFLLSGTAFWGTLILVTAAPLLLL